VLDEDLSDQFPVFRLLSEGAVDLLVGHMTLADEDLTNRSPASALRSYALLALLLDGVSQPGPETALRREPAGLLGERAIERRSGDEAAVDENLSEPAFGPPLLGERARNVLVGEKSAHDQQLAQSAPPCLIVDERLTHAPPW
jgi:hypothetical protein